MLWLAEAAIEGYFRDVLPAIPQVARGPFGTHICEHFIWPDAGRSPKQASKMSRTQAHQSSNAFQRYVPGYTRFHKFHDLGNFNPGQSRRRFVLKIIERSVQQNQCLYGPLLDV